MGIVNSQTLLATCAQRDSGASNLGAPLGQKDAGVGCWKKRHVGAEVSRNYKGNYKGGYGEHMDNLHYSCVLHIRSKPVILWEVGSSQFLAKEMCKRRESGMSYSPCFYSWS